MSRRAATVPQASPAQVADRLALRAARGIAHFRKAVEEAGPHHCPVCGYVGPFSPVRHKPSIWCPGCDSRPRHRLMKLWMDREMRLPATARVLHFAAEPWVGTLLRATVAEYVTADINDRFDLTLDITAMALPDARFDVIIANHVLEHVDDRAALAEIARVLAPGGFAVLSVPMVAGWDATYENPALTSTEDRALYYTDPTHLRLYGRDFAGRIAAAGLEVTEFPAVEPDVSRHALHRGERIFIGTRPPTKETAHG